MLTKPVCCGFEMRVRQVGVEVIELAGPDPYLLWQADELICSECGRTILYGFGKNPVARRGDFEMTQALQRGARLVRERTRAQLDAANIQWATETNTQWARNGGRR